MCPINGAHGQTGPADAYAFDLLTADLGEFLDACGLTAPILVGHSMGAVAVYLYAARHQTRPRALVLVEPPPPFPQCRLMPERPAGRLGYDWACRVALMEQVNAPDPRWLGQLAAIQVPALVIGGGPTSPFPQDQLRAMANRMPRGAFREVPVGHGVHREAPTTFLTVVTEFLNGANQDG